MATGESLDKAFEDEGFDEDEISFVSKKIHAIWKKKRGIRSRNFNKKAP